MSTVISIEHLNKQYHLGVIKSAYFYEDVQRWWARLCGRYDTLSKVGNKDHGNREGEYIWAVKDISFDVPQGQALSIIERNGAGKSTLLKILSSITIPTFGNSKIKGRLSSLLEVGTGFHQELTGHENIYLNGAILGIKKEEIDRKLDSIIDFAGVERYIGTPIKRYSSGMTVRLVFP